MDLIQAIILGIVQGLTEFIPISSTAHLIFTSRFLHLYSGNAEQTTATIAVLQLGTLAAVLIYFASDILSITAAFVRDHWNLLTNKRRIRFSGTHGKRPIWLSEEAWLGWLIILGSIPIGVIGIAFKKIIVGEATKNLWTIGIMMIAIAVLLTFAELLGKRRKELSEFGLLDSLAQGFAQCLALIPGASRSGSTLMGGLFAGQKREAAARFSFLLSIPAIAASGLLELKDAVEQNLLSSSDFVSLAVGTIVAGVIGYLSIWFLLSYLKKHSTAVFIAYRIIVGAVILILIWQNIIDPNIR